MNQVLEFLASIYLDGLECNTVNCYKSSVSAYHDKPGGVPIRQNEKVYRLLMGIFNKRSKQPKCFFVWGVSTLVNFMRGIEDNEKLTGKLLSLKLVTFLALLFSGKALEISYLDVKFITFKPNFTARSLAF